MPDERLNSNTASNFKITPELSFYGTKTRVEFNGSCLKQDKIIDRNGEFIFGSRGFDRNCIIFGADLSSSPHANNRKNNILILRKDFVQGINSTTIYVEKLCSINFTENN